MEVSNDISWKIILTKMTTPSPGAVPPPLLCLYPYLTLGYRSQLPVSNDSMFCFASTASSFIQFVNKHTDSSEIGDVDVAFCADAPSQTLIIINILRIYIKHFRQN